MESAKDSQKSCAACSHTAGARNDTQTVAASQRRRAVDVTTDSTPSITFVAVAVFVTMALGADANPHRY